MAIINSLKSRSISTDKDDNEVPNSFKIRNLVIDCKDSAQGIGISGNNFNTLPSEILYEILSRIPFRTVVQFSLVSKSYRYCWLEHVDFDAWSRDHDGFLVIPKHQLSSKFPRIQTSVVFSRETVCDVKVVATCVAVEEPDLDGYIMHKNRPKFIDGLLSWSTENTQWGFVVDNDYVSELLLKRMVLRERVRVPSDDRLRKLADESVIYCSSNALNSLVQTCSCLESSSFLRDNWDNANVVYLHSSSLLRTNVAAEYTANGYQVPFDTPIKRKLIHFDQTEFDVVVLNLHCLDEMVIQIVNCSVQRANDIVLYLMGLKYKKLTVYTNGDIAFMPPFVELFVNHRNLRIHITPSTKPHLKASLGTGST